MGTALLVVEQEPKHAMGFLRGLFSWFAAVGAASMTICIAVAVLAGIEAPPSGQDVVEFIGSIIPATAFLMLFVGALTAPVWPVLVWALKTTQAPRGSSDLIAGGLMGAGLIQLFGAPLARGETGLTLLFLGAGAVGGLVYWIVAGRPE